MRNIKELGKLGVRGGLENVIVAFNEVFGKDDLLPEGFDGPKLVVSGKATEDSLEIPPGVLRETLAGFFQGLASVLGLCGGHGVHL